MQLKGFHLTTTEAHELHPPVGERSRPRTPVTRKPHLLLESLTLFPKMMCRPPKRARSARPIVFVANLFFASLTKRPAVLLPDPIREQVEAVRSINWFSSCGRKDGGEASIEALFAHPAPHCTRTSPIWLAPRHTICGQPTVLGGVCFPRFTIVSFAVGPLRTTAARPLCPLSRLPPLIMAYARIHRCPTPLPR